MNEVMELIADIRALRKAKSLHLHWETIGQRIQSLKDPLHIERVGYILREVRIEEWSSSEGDPFTSCRFAVVSNGTIHALPNMIRALSVSQKIWPEIFLASHTDYRSLLLDTGGDLYRCNSHILVVLLEEHAILESISTPWSLETVSQACNAKIKEVHQWLTALTQHFTGTIVLTTVPLSRMFLDTIIDYKTKAAISRQWYQFNAELLDLGKQYKGLVVLDHFSLLQGENQALSVDPVLAYKAQMYFSEGLLAELAREMIKIYRALAGRNKKCLVVDLDNTLWGGIIGDDGLDGIQLGPEWPGKSFVDLQKCIKQLGSQGVMLAVNSKNSIEPVDEVFEKHPYMELRKGHFALMKINWEQKHSNLLEITKTLNISPESIVYMDDSAFERELIRKALPDVTVIDMPNEPELYKRALLNLGLFNSIELTDEDRRRNATYLEEAKRGEYAVGCSSFEEYLKGLEIQVHPLPLEAALIPRLSQLSMRTNQFNMTTTRLSESQLDDMLSSEQDLLYGFHVKDRFGDSGIVGLVHMYKSSKLVWQLKNFILSCRVFSRGIEDAMLAYVLDMAKRGSVEIVEAFYIPSAKNQRVCNFYSDHGFVRCATTPEKLVYQHILQDVQEPPTWITI